MPISPAPVSTHADDHLPAFVSNGVIGLRVRELPFLNGMATMTGLAGIDPVDDIEGAPFIPYPLALDIRVDGVFLSTAIDRVFEWRQEYDFACGELHSHTVVAVDGVRAQVSVVTFCSRTQPSVVCQSTTVTLDHDADVAFRTGVDTSGVPGRQFDPAAAAPELSTEVADTALVWRTRGELSSCGLACWAEVLGAGEVQRVASGYGSDARLRATRSIRAHAGRQYTVIQLATAVGEITHHQPDRAAVRMLVQAQRTGFERLRAENAEEWRRLWRSRLMLHGAPERWQALADGAFFYLHTSTHASSVSSVHLFGLSRWPDYHYYYGHVMWDLEVFALPPTLLVQPEAARAMLEYRFRSLPAARMNARMNGWLGAQFPWESEPMHGEEAAPLDGTAAFYEQHVSFGVARAFAQFADATADRDFLRERAWPVLQGVAQFIESRVTRSERGYEIRETMGIAERKQPSDNVAYVNMAAAVTLRDAVRVARQVGIDPPPVWNEIASGLTVPMRGKVVLSYDGWKPSAEKGATPSALAGVFPFGYDVPADVERATIERYLALWKDYIGSPMLAALYAAWAARIGDRDLALRLLDEGYAQYVSPRFMNVHEYRVDKFPEQPVAGPFFANLGGFLLDCYYGFPGISVRAGPPPSWCERPVVLPAGWDCIEVERLWAQGREWHLVAKHGDEHARLEPAASFQ